MLAKLGYMFKGNQLESLDVAAYNIIHNAVNDYNEEEMKRSQRKR